MEHLIWQKKYDIRIWQVDVGKEEAHEDGLCNSLPFGKSQEVLHIFLLINALYFLFSSLENI